MSIGDDRKSKLIEEIKPETKKSEQDDFKRNLQKAFEAQSKGSKGEPRDLIGIES